MAFSPHFYVCIYLHTMKKNVKNNKERRKVGAYKGKSDKEMFFCWKMIEFKNYWHK